MNIYKLSTPSNSPANLAQLRALTLMYFGSPQMTVSKEEVLAHLPFSLDNVQTGYLETVVLASDLTNTIEGFDKPIVEEGDIVVSLVSQGADSSSVKRWYDEYRVLVGFSTNDGQPCDLYIGISNSSKSDFNDPFNEAKITVIAHQKLAEEVSIYNQLD